MGIRGLRVLISGAGVAGPAVAYWLSRHGADTTVVEVAPALRTSGFAVDFRSPTQLGVLDRMGVLDDLRDVQTHAGAMRCVDERGATIFELPAQFAGGDIEVHRRDLSRVLYEHSAERTEYLFGDTITAVTDTGNGIEVSFARHQTRTFDLLIGADGLHSAVRRIAFGPEQRYVRHLGYYLAGWDLPNTFDTDPTPRQYNVPGQMISVGADSRDPSRATALAVWAAPRLEHLDFDRQKQLIAEVFAGVGWQAPALLATLPAAPELYFDAICRVRVPAWSSGRVALLGDAAWGVTLGGMGVGTGIVGAYVLSGELAAADGDHVAGFSGYEKRMRGYAGRWQRGASPGKFLAPSSAFGLRLRNTLLGTRLVQRMMVSSTVSMATSADLPEYAAIG